MHYAIRCPCCGKWQAVITKNLAVYSLRCRFCGKNTKLKQGMFKVQWHGPFDGQTVGHVIRQQNAEG